MPFTGSGEVVCIWPVVAEKDENLKQSMSYGGRSWHFISMTCHQNP